MTATTHALVGGAIAASVKDPTLGLTLSALSHPVLDMVPHWDFGWGWRKKSKLTLFTQTVFDLTVGVALAIVLFSRYSPSWGYFFACIFLSEIWDIVEAPYWFLNWHFPPFSWIYKVQSRLQGKTSSVTMGILTQVASFLIIVWVLQNLK